MDNETRADATTVGMTIDDQGLDEQVDSLEVEKYKVVDLLNALFVTKKGIDAQTVHTRTGLILNFVHIVG